MENILEVKRLKKYFKTGNGLLHAVDDVSFGLAKGSTLGVVGESGCGKSTLARVIVGLTPATDGQIIFDGRDITNPGNAERKRLKTEAQMIFQDPFSSLNPRMCVFELIADPLKVHHVHKSKAELEKHVVELMDTVGLAKRFAFSYPHELDGGRRQRIGVARALALNPRLVLCDEPVSALDVSIQAQILNLLQDLQQELGMTYIFITHDMSVVKHISDEIMVMYVGGMVEKCSSRELYKRPLHPYTKGLLAAIPIPKIRRERQEIIMKGEIASPIGECAGCRFASRCEYATEECRTKKLSVEEVFPGHFVACHHVREINGI